jgi:hypothetical protein
LIDVRDVLTEDDWYEVRLLTPGPPFEFVKSRRKSRKTGKHQEFIRFLPYPEGWKEDWETRAIATMLPRIGYRMCFAVFDRS